MTKERLVLLPAPQVLRRSGGVCRLETDALLALRSPHGAGELAETGTAVAEALADAGLPVALSGQASPAAAVAVEIEPGLFRKAESYKLDIRQRRIRLLAADPAGAWYGAMTLRQLCRQVTPGRGLPCLFIEDWPDFANRGIMLDISRDKVPSLEYLFQLVDLMSELKLNQFQLYTEHTFAYRAHEAVWKDASPMTAAEILELDAHCRRRHIQLVPNQNSFGHMERWLKHKAYLPLAEAAKGCELPWGGRIHHAFGLCPGDPHSLKLIQGLYDELLPNFSSRLFNVGCDETFDLGQGRSRKECERRGKGRVYLDFLLQIHREVRNRGRTMQFWGDIILKHPELIPELPPDVIPLVWGYEDDHPFAEQCAKYGASGFSFYVAPGTSTWNTVAGRTDNALGNLRSAAENGMAAGAVGFLNTDWGDNGHWQPNAVSLLPYAYGAAVSWAGAANRDADLPAALDLHVFQDAAGVLGRVAFDLGNAYRGIGGRPVNRSNLHAILFNAAGDTLFASGPVAETTLASVEARGEEITAQLERLAKSRSVRPDAEVLKAEFLQAGSLVRWACRLAAARLRRKDKKLGSVPLAARRRLAAEIRELLAIQPAVWLSRNRPGGLSDSLRRLEPLGGIDKL